MFTLVIYVLSGICDCQSTRDTFLYAASVDSRGLEPTVEILGEVVLRPQFSPEELEMCEMTIRWEESLGLLVTVT